MSGPLSERLAAALGDRYRIERELGEGGMATVYLAEDLKHDRKVAIKVLRPELAAIIGGERFLAEIKTTANLQHPHILPLFDSGESDGFLYYVMPYVEGRSLRELLEQERQLDVDEAVRIADAVANALHYAHERGIIHRDIKPANILLHAGEPVVADFGIALAISAAGGGRLTETGLSLGTPHYMSPEQASADRDLSARSDVYSLSCVLYEMLAGQPPHTGPSAQSVLVRILTEEPRPVTEIRRAVPPHLQAALSKGLEKLPADRFRTAQELRDALHDPSFRYQPTPRARPPAPEPPPPHPSPPLSTSAPRRSRWWAAHVAVTAVLSLSTLGLLLARGGSTTEAGPGPILSFVVADSGVPEFGRPAVANDGTVAWVADGLRVRPSGATRDSRLDASTALPAPAVDLSPDGAFLVVPGAEGSTLLRRPVEGGAVTTLATTADGSFAVPTWGSDGGIYTSIVSGTGTASRIARVPEVGGAVETLLEIELFVVEVHPLPGGRGLLFCAAAAPGRNARIVALDIESGDTATVVEAGFGPRWSPSGHLLYADPDGRIMAAPFDPERLRVTGSAVPVLEDVAAIANIVLPLDLSETGTLVYHQGPYVGGTGTLGTWSFRLSTLDGRSEPLRIDPSDHWDARLSPDGGRMAYVRDGDVWVFDLDLGANRRVTSDGSDAHNPTWSPDGGRIAFRQTRDGRSDDVFVVDATGSTDPEWIGGSDVGDNPAEWLEDGTILVSTDGARYDILTLRVGGDTMATPVLQADWLERGSSISPDGRWIAYESDETDTREVYVRSWPDLGQKTRISDGDLEPGFSYPQWASDGGSLYYAGRDGRVVAAELDTSRGLRVVERRPTGVEVGVSAYIQDIHPDGRMLIASQATGSDLADGPGERRIVVVTNWLDELRRKLGEGR